MESSLWFNVDGSSLGNPGMAGIGGVLRDADGKVRCVFSECIGFLDSYAAELHAILKAILLCETSSFVSGRNVEIVSDCKVVVDWINSDGFGNINLVNFIYDIRGSLQRQGNVAVVFAGRASNFFADKLAKMGATGAENFVEWSTMG